MKGCFSRCCIPRATKVIEFLPPPNHLQQGFIPNAKIKGKTRRSEIGLPKLVKDFSREKHQLPAGNGTNTMVGSARNDDSAVMRLSGEKSLQDGDHRDLIKELQVKSMTPQRPGPVIHEHPINANVRTLKLLKARRKVRTGNTQSAVSADNEESSNVTNRKTSHVHQSCKSHSSKALTLEDMQDLNVVGEEVIIRETKDITLTKNVNHGVAAMRKVLLSPTLITDSDSDNMAFPRREKDQTVTAKKNATIHPRVMVNRWFSELGTPKFKKKKMESYEEFVNGLVRTAKKVRAVNDLVKNVKTPKDLYDRKHLESGDAEISTEKNRSIMKSKFKVARMDEEEAKTGGNHCFRSSTPTTDITEDDFEFSTRCPKPMDKILAVEGKMLGGTVIAWPRQIHGCQQNTPAPAQGEMAPTFKPKVAWDDVQDNVSKTKDDTLGDATASLDETGKDTIELEQFFALISK